MPKQKAPNKRKAKLTLAKYRENNNKKKKNDPSEPDVNTPVSATAPNTNNCSQTTSAIRSNSYYIRTESNDGIDLSTFRLVAYRSYIAPKTISSSLSNTLNSKFVYNINTPTSSSSKEDILSKVPYPLLNKNRCVLEDVMTLPEYSEITLLVPKPKRNEKKENLSYVQKNIYVECEKSFIQYGNTKNQRYYIYSGFIHSCPYASRSKNNALNCTEVNNALGRHRNNGYGFNCTIQQCLINNCFSEKSEYTFKLSIKWADVLHGRRTGIQIWTHMNQLRDFTTNFRSLYGVNLESSMNNMLGFISEEVYCDKLATTNLLLKYFMVQSQKKQIENTVIKSNVVNNISNNFDRVTYNYVNSIIEQTFYEAIERCYKGFNKITQPLLSRVEVNKLVDIYKENLCQHYKLQMKMFGFAQKQELSRNQHLKDSGYYDKLVFYTYLSHERIRFNQFLASWGMITAGAVYARGRNSVDNKSFFGNSTTVSTFMKRTKYWRENMNSYIHQTLSNEASIVACIDNNQKGFGLKYQRFGSSNNYIKVTGCVIKRHLNYTPAIDDIENEAHLTYYEQNIPSPHKMMKYETVDDNSESIYALFMHHVTPYYKKEDLNYDSEKYASEDIDFSGNRVQAYHKHCMIYDTVNYIRMVTAGIYHRTNQSFNYVEFSPDKWKTHDLQIIVQRMNNLKGSIFFKGIKLFQRHAARQWNPHFDDVCDLIVPQVMLHDEITTDGYGKCIIELLTLHGILDKCFTGNNIYEWRLSQKWNEKTIILCLDGLSLDRHRGFCNKLIKLPMSFTKAYRQCQIFQKALTRVIDISGPLHTSFHMLQSVYIVYNGFLRCIQECLGWKKITYHKVSENFRLCVHMIDIAYEEVFRVLFFNFMCDEYDGNISNSLHPIDEILAIDLSREFQTYIDSKHNTTTDDKLKYLIAFYKMTKIFCFCHPSYFKLSIQHCLIYMWRKLWNLWRNTQRRNLLEYISCNSVRTLQYLLILL